MWVSLLLWLTLAIGVLGDQLVTIDLSTFSTTQGTWYLDATGSCGPEYWSNIGGSTFSYTFLGTGWVLGVSMHANSGVVQTSDDGGKTWSPFNEYSPTDVCNHTIEHTSLAYGQYTVQIQLVSGYTSITKFSYYTLDTNQWASVSLASVAGISAQIGQAISLQSVQSLGAVSVQSMAALQSQSIASTAALAMVGVQSMAGMSLSSALGQLQAQASAIIQSDISAASTSSMYVVQTASIASVAAASASAASRGAHVGSLTAGAFAGIIIAAVIGFLSIILLVIYLTLRWAKRQRRREEEEAAANSAANVPNPPQAPAMGQRYDLHAAASPAPTNTRSPTMIPSAEQSVFHRQASSGSYPPPWSPEAGVVQWPLPETMSRSTHGSEVDFDVEKERPLTEAWPPPAQGPPYRDSLQ